MWNKPWTIREGLAIGGGLIIIGQLLQCFTGGIDWQLFAFPANLITLGFYLLSLGVRFSQKALRCAILLYAVSRCSRHWFRVGAHLYHGHHPTSARRKPSHRPHRPLVHAHLLAVRTRLSLAQ